MKSDSYIGLDQKTSVELEILDSIEEKEHAYHEEDENCSKNPSIF